MPPFRRELGPIEVDQRYAEGVQEYLYIASVPAGADPLLVGKTLAGQTLTVAGTYVCYMHLAGMNAVEVHLMATVTGTAPTTSGGSMFLDQTTQKTAFTGVGLMVNATRQTLTFAAGALKGEKVATVNIALPAASTAAFTQAEYNGIR